MTDQVTILGATGSIGESTLDVIHKHADRFKVFGLSARNRVQKLAKIAKINAYHVSLFSEFLQKLKATPDGDGSLLDHTIYMYGSGIGNPSLHDHENLPVLVAGGGQFGLTGGQHILYVEQTPLANLHLTLLDRVGVRLDSFGDSSGQIENLFDSVAV